MAQKSNRKDVTYIEDYPMKDCAIFRKGLCTGCVGLAEKDWIGPEQCSTYKKLNNISGLELCKKILEGEQQKI